MEEENKQEINKEDKKVKAAPWRQAVWGGVLALVILIVGYIVVIGIGIYGANWDNKATEWTARIIPYPAALVDFNVIDYATYQEDYATLEQYLEKQQELGTTEVTIPTDSELSQTVVDKLIRSELLDRLAKQYNVSVDQSEVDDELQGIYDSAEGGRAEVADTLEELYGWTPEEFGQKIIYEYLLREKLSEALQADEELNKSAKELAENIKSNIESGQLTFEQAAQTYSEDTGSASTGGDVGNFVVGEMVESFQNAVVNAEIGELVGPVQSEYGYHIIMRTEPEVVQDADGNDLANPEGTYRASHILIMTTTLDEVLNNMYDEATIYNFVN